MISARRKQSYDDRCTEMRRRKSLIPVIPHHLATVEVRKARLAAIRDKMKMSTTDFCRLLGVAIVNFYRPSVILMRWAEINLQRFYNNNYKRRMRSGLLQFEKMQLPDEFKEDPSIRTGVIKAYAIGKSREEIAAEMAIRPEIVDFYISNVE